MKYTISILFTFVCFSAFPQSIRIPLHELEEAGDSGYIIRANALGDAEWYEITEYNGDTVIVWHPTLKKFGFIHKDSISTPLPDSLAYGTGTTNYIPRWIAPFTLGTAGISDDGNEIQFARPTVLYGVNTAAPATYGAFGIDNTLGIERPTYYNGSAWVPWLAYSGGTNQYSYFSNSNTITSGTQLTRDANGVSVGDGNYFRLPNNTTVGSKLTAAGHTEFNTTAQNFSFRTSTATEYPVKSASSTGLGTNTRVGYFDTAGRLTGSSSFTFSGGTVSAPIFSSTEYILLRSSNPGVYFRRATSERWFFSVFGVGATYFNPIGINSGDFNIGNEATSASNISDVNIYKFKFASTNMRSPRIWQESYYTGVTEGVGETWGWGVERTASTKDSNYFSLFYRRDSTTNWNSGGTKSAVLSPLEILNIYPSGNIRAKFYGNAAKLITGDSLAYLAGFTPSGRIGEVDVTGIGYLGWTYHDIEGNTYTEVASGDTLSIDDENGIIDSLPNGSIVIDANNNTLTINDLDEFDINDNFEVFDTSYFNSQWLYNRNNSSEFGSGIALSGNFLLISDPAFNSTKGRVTAFKNTGNVFDSVGVLNPTFTGSPGAFGRIIDGEGGYFVISAESSNTAAFRAGEAFVYRDSSGYLVYDDNLIASPASADDFGAKVSISNTNTPTVAYGIPNRASGGAVAIFQDSVGGWVQKLQFAPSDLAAGDGFGIYTDIWNDTLVVAGSYLDDDTYTNNGAVYVFADTTGGNWSAPPIQRAKITVNIGGLAQQLGRIVQVKDSIIIATSASTSNVFVFTRQAGTNTWNLTQTLSVNATSSFQFENISLRGDYLVIGSVANGYLGTKVYKNISGTFVLVENVTAIDAVSGDNFGFAVDISEDGNTLVIGSRLDDDLGTNRGKAYVYENLLNRVEVKENLIVTDKTTGLPNFWFKDGLAIFGDYDGTKTASVLGKTESGNILGIATDGTVIEVPDSTLGSGSVTYGYIKTTQDTLANSDLTVDTVAVAKFSLQSGVSSGITVPTDSTFQVNSTGVYEVSWEGDWESDTSVGESATIFFYANGSIADTITTRYPADRSNFKYTVLLSLTASTDNKIRVLGEDGDIIIYNSRLIIKKL